MKSERIKLKVKDIVNGYVEVGFLGEHGIYACGGKLAVCLPYSSANDLSDFYCDGVVFSVLNGMPLGTMYFVKKTDGLEVIDGKKRLITLCRYIADEKFDGCKIPFRLLKSDEKQKILDYEVEAFIVEGSREELAEWLKIINAREHALREQEMLNACCCGDWLKSAKEYFSGRNCKAYMLGSDLMSGKPEEQHYLSKALSWIADYKGLKSGKEYMFEHADDTDAAELVDYYERVMHWTYDTFPARRKERKGVEWGLLYNRFCQAELDAYQLDSEVKKLLDSENCYNRHGVFAYVLTRNKRYLSTPFVGD